MITSVEIKNFKSIKSLAIDLPKFTVLVGPNGSGKTNVVQALELFGQMVGRGSTSPARERGWAQLVRRAPMPARGGITLGVGTGLRFGSGKDGQFSLDIGEPISLLARLTFGRAKGTDDMRPLSEEVVAKSSRGSLSVRAGQSGWELDAGDDPLLWNLFFLGTGQGRTPPRSREEANRALEAAFRVNEPPLYMSVAQLRILNRVFHHAPWIAALAQDCEVSRFRLDASGLRSDSSFSDHRFAPVGSTGEGLAAAVEALRGHGEKPARSFQGILDSLQKVYPRIDDVRAVPVAPGRLTLAFRERGVRDELGQTNVSDGVLHALALLIVLERARQPYRRGLVAIEEPENAIHPWSLRFMMERAQGAAQQVLVTTHSETVVNAVSDPASLLIVENDDRKGTIVTRARDRESALDTILSESGQKLGDIWMDGSLGGVPGQ